MYLEIISSWELGCLIMGHRLLSNRHKIFFTYRGTLLLKHRFRIRVKFTLIRIIFEKKTDRDPALLLYYNFSFKGFLNLDVQFRSDLWKPDPTSENRISAVKTGSEPPVETASVCKSLFFAEVDGKPCETIRNEACQIPFLYKGELFVFF